MTCVSCYIVSVHCKYSLSSLRIYHNGVRYFQELWVSVDYGDTLSVLTTELKGM